MYWAHWFLPTLGAFLCVGGTYGVVQSIINAYADGQIGKPLNQQSPVRA
jgi:hypothetical protein